MRAEATVGGPIARRSRGRPIARRSRRRTIVGRAGRRTEIGRSGRRAEAAVGRTEAPRGGRRPKPARSTEARRTTEARRRTRRTTKARRRPKARRRRRRATEAGRTRGTNRRGADRAELIGGSRGRAATRTDHGDPSLEDPAETRRRGASCGQAYRGQSVADQEKFDVTSPSGTARAPNPNWSREVKSDPRAVARTNEPARTRGTRGLRAKSAALRSRAPENGLETRSRGALLRRSEPRRATRAFDRIHQPATAGERALIAFLTSCCALRAVGQLRRSVPRIRVEEALRVWPAFAVQPLSLPQGALPPPGAGSKFRHLHPWFRGPDPETAERVTE